MGRGIAQVAAMGPYQVIVYDIDPGTLEAAQSAITANLRKGVSLGKVKPETAEAALAGLQFSNRLATAEAADLIIEAAPEDMALKRQLFAALDSAVAPETILATNTSSLSISALASATRRPDRFIGLHFFNPAHLMALVEIIAGDLTSQATLDACCDFVRRIGKTAVICQDTPAFIVNRVARPFYGEAFRLLGEKAAGVEDIDRLARSLGFRMGPFELVDLIGCDVNFAVTQSVYDAYFHDPKYRPHPIQRRMVESGRLGRKTGRGFYTYD